MVGKNNYKTRTEKAANKKQRFSLKKLSVGVASVAVGTTLFLSNTDAVSGEENPDRNIEQLQAALETEKEFAIAEVQAAGFTDQKYVDWINAQETVQDVNGVKREILTTVPDEEQSGIEEETSVDSESDFNAPDFDWSGNDEAVAAEAELQAAKESAIAEVKAAGFTDQKYVDWINAQETVQDVNGVKREILTTVPDEEQSGIEGETSVDSEYDFNEPEIDWSGNDEAVAEEEAAQEEVYTLNYYA